MGRSVAQLYHQYFRRRIAYSDTANKRIVVWFCRCVDVRVAYGSELLLLQPEAGEGSFLAKADKCKVINEQTAPSGPVAEGRPNRTGGP